MHMHPEDNLPVVDTFVQPRLLSAPKACCYSKRLRKFCRPDSVPSFALCSYTNANGVHVL